MGLGADGTVVPLEVADAGQTLQQAPARVRPALGAVPAGPPQSPGIRDSPSLAGVDIPPDAAGLALPRPVAQATIR